MEASRLFVLATPLYRLASAGVVPDLQHVCLMPPRTLDLSSECSHSALIRDQRAYWDAAGRKALPDFRRPAKESAKATGTDNVAAQDAIGGGGKRKRPETRGKQGLLGRYRRGWDSSPRSHCIFLSRSVLRLTRSSGQHYRILVVTGC